MIILAALYFLIGIVMQAVVMWAEKYSSAEWENWNNEQKMSAVLWGFLTVVAWPALILTGVIITYLNRDRTNP